MARPRPATLDVSRPEPAAYLARSVEHGLHHGLPARRRLGPLAAAVGRAGLPTAPLAAALRWLPARPDAALDRLLDDLVAAWPELAAASRALPPSAPDLTAVVVQRSAARTLFVLSPGGRLLVVVKRPGADRSGVDAELAALAAARDADIAPRSLGAVGEAVVQEGLPGAPMRLPAVRPRTADRLDVGAAFHSLGQALARLARVTAGRRDLETQLLAPLDLALRAGVLSPAAERLLSAARRDLRGLDVGVLQHGDLSAQNWMVSGQDFAGLVDWETAVHAGVPGFDALHAGVSLLEHGVGLVRWSPARLEASFAAAWGNSSLFEHVRAAQALSSVAAGVPESMVEPLRLAFFGRRLGRRLRRPSAYVVGPTVAAAAVETVCRS